MKNFKLFLCYFFVSFSIVNMLSKEICIYQSSELFENQLFDFLYRTIDREVIKKTKFSDLTNQKSTNLNFRDAVLLYLFSMQDKKYRKYSIWALERIYALSSDAQLNEFVLWNLAFYYEKKENFVLSSSLYSVFKKMFPGSSFYWESRYKEILMCYQYCHQAYHDISDIEKTMLLCEEYMLDIEEMKGDFSFKVVEIYQDLSLRIIRKNLGIVAFYDHKFSYSREISTFFSCFQRLNNIFNKIKHFLDFSHPEFTHKKNQVYLFSLKEIGSLLEDFFLFHELQDGLPAGDSFIEDRAKIEDKIKKDRSAVKESIDNIFQKINNFVDAYYEL
jgi:hypothetical protein